MRGPQQATASVTLNASTPPGTKTPNERYNRARHSRAQPLCSRANSIGFLTLALLVNMTVTRLIF